MSTSEGTWSIGTLMGSRVQGLKEYAPEPMEQLAERLGLPMGQLIKLDANENPYGSTRAALDALTAFHDYHRYPDPISRTLRRAISEYIQVAPEHILVGNGSDELIDLILRLFRPGPEGGGVGEVIDCPPTFGMYSFYGTTNDMRVRQVPRGKDFCVDLAAIEGLCASDPQPRVLFLASPNNPDGQVLSDEALDRLLQLPLVVVLDEAYVEFSGGSRVGWVPERTNLIVLRTFSKWAGLAGLRVGYGVFPEPLMQGLWRLKSPYNANIAAQVAAEATLECIDEAQERIDRIVAERERLIPRLREIPYLDVYASQANYVLCRLSGVTVNAVREAMEARGLILRYFQTPGLEDCIRITVGTPMQDESLLIVLRGLRD